MKEQVQKKYARPRTMADTLDIAVSTLWKMVKEDRIPRPHKLSPRVTVFDVDEVLAFVDDLKNGKEGQHHDR